MCERPFRERLVEASVVRWARATSWVRDQTTVGSTAVAGLVAAYGVATLCDTKDVPSEFWQAGHVGAWLIVVLGVVAGVGSFVVTVSVGGLLRRAEIDRKLTDTCRDVAWLVEHKTSIPHGTLGVHVWEVVGPPLLRRLKRRSTFRSTDHRPLAIVWRKGKGVLGACWAGTSEDELFDLSTIDARNEAEFCALAPHKRLNMNWAEFQMGKHYRTIWATKLYAGPKEAPKVGGLLSIDVEVLGHTEELRSVIEHNQRELRNLLNLCESLLRESRGKFVG